jgi:hypothetical protein
MTWTLNLTGHVADETAEKVVLNEIKAILKAHESWGVLSGQFSGMFSQESLTLAPEEPGHDETQS